jgi:hypothetical protein
MEETNYKIDELEAAMLASSPTVNCELKHVFTPGLYSRTIFMPAGSLITSLIHRTEHQFFVLKGKVSVLNTIDGEQLLEAGFRGITKPGTRRVLFIHEDCIWTTVHPTTVQPKDNSKEAKDEAVALIEAEIIEPHINPLLGGIVKNNIITPIIETNFNNELNDIP